jgi:hypothetical protein
MSFLRTRDSLWQTGCQKEVRDRRFRKDIVFPFCREDSPILYQELSCIAGAGMADLNSRDHTKFFTDSEILPSIHKFGIITLGLTGNDECRSPGGAPLQRRDEKSMPAAPRRCHEAGVDRNGMIFIVPVKSESINPVFIFPGFFIMGIVTFQRLNF